MSIFSKVRKGFVNAFVSPSAKAAGEIGSNKGAVDFFLAGGPSAISPRISGPGSMAGLVSGEAGGGGAINYFVTDSVAPSIQRSVYEKAYNGSILSGTIEGKPASGIWPGFIDSGMPTRGPLGGGGRFDLSDLAAGATEDASRGVSQLIPRTTGTVGPSRPNLFDVSDVAADAAADTSAKTMLGRPHGSSIDGKFDLTDLKAGAADDFYGSQMSASVDRAGIPRVSNKTMSQEFDLSDLAADAAQDAKTGWFPNGAGGTGRYGSGQGRNRILPDGNLPETMGNPNYKGWVDHGKVNIPGRNPWYGPFMSPANERKWAGRVGGRGARGLQKMTDYGKSSVGVAGGAARFMATPLIGAAAGAGIAAGTSQSNNDTGLAKDMLGGALLGGLGGLAAKGVFAGAKASAKSNVVRDKAGKVLWKKTAGKIADRINGTATGVASGTYKVGKLGAKVAGLGAKAAGFALRHPKPVIAAGLGAAAVYAASDIRQDVSGFSGSETLRGTGVSSSGFAAGRGGSTKQQAREMYANSTNGLVQGMHRGRHNG